MAGGLLPSKIILGGEQHFTQLGGGGHPGGITFILVATLGVFTKGMNDIVSSQLRGIDGFNPQELGVGKALAGGVTTVGTGPGSANVLGVGVNKAGIDTQSDDVYDFLTSLGGEHYQAAQV